MERVKGKRVTVIGGSGFIGRHLVQRLASGGAQVTVGVRHPEEADFLQPMGNVGQIVIVPASVTHEKSLQVAVAGADAVVNLVGILYQRGRRSFDAIHRQGAEAVARAAREAGATRFVHMSALGADLHSEAKYAASKAAGEEAVRAVFPGASIVRPSVVFGPQDGFLNLFASLARFSPVLPVIGSRDGPRFQPVYVGDVADAIMKCLVDPATAGKTYELGGPAVYTFREILELILRETGRRRLLLTLPFWAATLEATFLQFLPKPLLTPDQVKLLRHDNILTGKLPTLTDLGIQPTGMEAIVPTYLDRYRRGGRFNRIQRA